MTGRSFWEPFVKDARALSNERLDAWLDRWDPIILAQYARRGYRSTRPPNQPLSTGGLEAVIKPVQTALFPRRYGLKNRERLNRLLNLVQLELNGDADERDYTRLIRAWLEENNGRPRIRRRAVTDPRGAPSLRALGARSMTAAPEPGGAERVLGATRRSAALRPAHASR